MFSQNTCFKLNKHIEFNKPIIELVELEQIKFYTYSNIMYFFIILYRVVLIRLSLKKKKKMVKLRGALCFIRDL